MLGYNYKTIVNNVLKAIKVYEIFSKIGGKKRIKDFTWLFITKINEKEKLYVINRVKVIKKRR
jgi:hypothetical protein